MVTPKIRSVLFNTLQQPITLNSRTISIEWVRADLAKVHAITYSAYSDAVKAFFVKFVTHQVNEKLAEFF